MPYLPHTNPDHDEDLVARLAADDLPADEREGRLARAWVAECPACAELVADLLVIASATAALPPPRRTRDFRLTEADAARLRPAGWRGLVGRFGSPTFAFTKPLAAGMATLGIAGLLLAAIPTGLGGASTAAPDRVSTPGGNALGAQDSSSEYASGAPAARPSAAPLPGVLAPEASAAPASGAPPSAAASADVRDTGVDSSPLPASGSGGGSVTSGGGSKGSASPAGVVATANPAAEVPPREGYALQDAGGGPSPLILLSLGLLVGGLALVALRMVARRIA